MLPIVGIGAGLVSALLLAVTITGSTLAALLTYVAPLPILIAALGWNHRAGLVATAAGAIAISVVLRYQIGIAFAIGIGLPAWWISYLVLLGRDTGDGRMEWFPLGRVLAWIGLIASAMGIAIILAISTDFEVYRGAVTRQLEAFLAEASRGRPGLGLPGDIAVPDLAAVLTLVLPMAVAASFVAMFVVNLWLAGKAVKISGRLPRPWPFIPATRLPRRVVTGLGIALVVALAPGHLGLIGGTVASGLVAAFALAGLAAAHDLSRGKGWRMPVLAATYVALMVMLITVFPFLALIGIADSLFDLRARIGTPPPPPPAAA